MSGAAQPVSQQAAESAQRDRLTEAAQGAPPRQQCPEQYTSISAQVLQTHQTTAAQE